VQRDEWRRRAADYVLVPRTIERVTYQPLKPLPHRPEHEAALDDVLLGEHGLTEQRSTFDRGRVIQVLRRPVPAARAVVGQSNPPNGGFARPQAVLSGTE